MEALGDASHVRITLAAIAALAGVAHAAISRRDGVAGAIRRVQRTAGRPRHSCLQFAGVG